MPARAPKWAKVPGADGDTLAVGYAPDGSHVATAGEDATTKVWDRVTGQQLLTLVGHNTLVYGVDFSPDGRLLATAGPDGTVALHLRLLVWVVAVVGTADLVSATATGIGGQLADTASDWSWVILTCYVPVLWVTAVLTFWQLATRRRESLHGDAHAGGAPMFR